MGLIREPFSGSTATGTNTVTIYTVPSGRNLYLTRATMGIVGTITIGTNQYQVIWDGTLVRALEVTDAITSGSINLAGPTLGLCFAAGSSVEYTYANFTAGLSYGGSIEGILI